MFWISRKILALASVRVFIGLGLTGATAIAQTEQSAALPVSHRLRIDYDCAAWNRANSAMLMRLFTKSELAATIDISKALNQEIADGVIDIDTATLILTEVEELADRNYCVPHKKSELLNGLGLAKLPQFEPTNFDAAPAAETMSSAKDWEQLLSVHLESTLMVAPQTGQFILSLMGLHTIEVKAQAPVTETPAPPSTEPVR